MITRARTLLARTAKPLAIFGAGAVLFAATVGVAVPVAMRLGPPSQPIIATVNLEEVVKGLDERTVREGELELYSKDRQGEMDKLVAQMKNEQSKMANLDGAEKEAAATRLLDIQVNAKVKKELYEALIDQRRGKVFKALYEKISEASKRLAEKSGYTMVISSDESVQIPPDATSQDIQRTISLKRFLYVNKAHDVTSELVMLMNNEFKNGVAAAPVAPSPAAGGK
jgi:Skp family chaperone for outer membrane proteins